MLSGTVGDECTVPLVSASVEWHDSRPVLRTWNLRPYALLCTSADDFWFVAGLSRVQLCTRVDYHTCLSTHTDRVFFPVPLCALRSWYDAERQRNEIEESSSGPCMNQHVAPSGVTHLTDKHKERLSNELRAILEGWHGGPLELTSIYGIR
jgi:hypothetical protein